MKAENGFRITKTIQCVIAGLITARAAKTKATLSTK